MNTANGHRGWTAASTRDRRACGFTLVELMVVVGIIMLLLALSFPGLAYARRRAVQFACLSNLRQAGLGLHAYLADFGYRYPDKAFGAQSSWFGKAGLGGYAQEGLQADDRPLNPYVGGPYPAGAEIRMAKCPMDIVTRARWGTPDSWYNFEGSSYLANTPTSDSSTSGGGAHEGLAGDGLVDAAGRGRTATDVRRPASLIAFAEVGAYGACWYSAATWVQYRDAFLWHSENVWNVAFADGHATSAKIEPQALETGYYTFHREH